MAVSLRMTLKYQNPLSSLERFSILFIKKYIEFRKDEVRLPYYFVNSTILILSTYNRKQVRRQCQFFHGEQKLWGVVNFALRIKINSHEIKICATPINSACNFQSIPNTPKICFKVFNYNVKKLSYKPKTDIVDKKFSKNKHLHIWIFQNKYSFLIIIIIILGNLVSTKPDLNSIQSL